MIIPSKILCALMVQVFRLCDFSFQKIHVSFVGTRQDKTLNKKFHFLKLFIYFDMKCTAEL